MLTSVFIYNIIHFASRSTKGFLRVFSGPDSDSTRLTGCGSVWLERLVWDQEAAGSNPVTPIMSNVCEADV